MIKLKNITIKNDIVKCDIIPEDCQNSGFIEIDVSNNKIIDYALPLGYEWCKNHIQHAKSYILNACARKETLPSEKTLIWY